ncbi:unnamed protein product [Brachionus calyciflorus]|uniref:GOLD domain-containing protein n=1 Tax=Brachionus calyciflorus TaxID=104777 RepID=A0A813M634_9BILA|nr:unnamed protein product [Brachionus calyciflorus]
MYVNSQSNAETVQLTFELPDNEVQCFYEHINKGVSSTVEFQVVTGGNYDVDVTLKNPQGTVLYQDQKKQYDSFKHSADMDGVYEVCFSNEFSTFTHKVVFLDWTIGDEAPLMAPASPEKALTFMEATAHNIHEKLEQIADQQTHYRLRETQGRAHAEDLNERVQLWSIANLCVIFVIGFLQVTVIRTIKKVDIERAFKLVSKQIFKNNLTIETNDKSCSINCTDRSNWLQKPNHQFSTNGCGSYNINVDFTKLNMNEFNLCCDIHDFCYETCSETKINCDTRFNNCLNGQCEKWAYEENWLTWKEKTCSSVVKLMTIAVENLGCLTYRSSQQNACFCSLE